MAVKTYNLFISHSWTYEDAYDKLCNLLNAASNFSWRDYSVPRADPVHNASSTAALYAAIKVQMTFCHAVLIMAGVYASYSKWIDREIQLATRDLSKPIVAVRPWGNERMSQLVQENATRIVSWNTNSIVTAIRDVAL